MRQSTKISKLTSLRAGFAVLSIFALIGISGAAMAADTAPMAPDAKAAVPGKPKADPTVGEALYSNGDSKRGVVACITCHGPKGQSAVSAWPKLSAQHAAYTNKQLKNFKEGSRANPIMMGMSATRIEDGTAAILTIRSCLKPKLAVRTNCTRKSSIHNNDRNCLT